MWTCMRIKCAEFESVRCSAKMVVEPWPFEISLVPYSGPAMGVEVLRGMWISRKTSKLQKTSPENRVPVINCFFWTNFEHGFSSHTGFIRLRNSWNYSIFLTGEWQVTTVKQNNDIIHSFKRLNNFTHAKRQNKRKQLPNFPETTHSFMYILFTKKSKYAFHLAHTT